MPSAESRIIDDLYKFLLKYLSVPGSDVESYRIFLEELHMLTTEPTDVLYEEVICPGTVRPAIWCKPLRASSNHVILYLHGGAFMAGSPSSHRKMVGHLAKLTGCYAILPDYRRAPENQHPAALDDAMATYNWLLGTGIAPGCIVTAGDSAGGYLSVASALKLRELGLPLPGAIIGLSPFLDVKMSGESYTKNESSDVLVGRADVQGMIAGYLGSQGPDQHDVDLLQANLENFPPTYLATGASEIIASDSVLFAEKAEKAGVEVRLELSEGMQHLYFLMFGKAPEANITLSNIAQWLREKLDLHRDGEI